MGLAGHRCPAKAARIAALEAAARARRVGVRGLLTGWLDPASGPAEAWNWTARLGLRGPERVTAVVERLPGRTDLQQEPAPPGSERDGGQT